MTVRTTLGPWPWQAAIVDPKTGLPNGDFLRWLQGARMNEDWGAGQLGKKADKATRIIAGDGLVGGGDLSAERTLALAPSGVAPGSYTSTDLTVDEFGRITAASSGSGGSGATSPDLVTFSISVGSNKTVAAGAGGVYIITTANGSGIQAQMTTDSAPLTFILGMQGNAQADFNSFGIAIRDSAGKFVTLGRLSTTSIELGQWSNATTFASSTYSAGWQKPPMYFRAMVDASNDIQFAVSESKAGPWFDVGPLNSYLATVDAVGFYCNRNHASINPICWFLDYALT